MQPKRWQPSSNTTSNVWPRNAASTCTASVESHTTVLMPMSCENVAMVGSMSEPKMRAPSGKYSRHSLIEPPFFTPTSSTRAPSLISAYGRISSSYVRM